jgi:predicted O-methyltransferase YrrM
MEPPFKKAFPDGHYYSPLPDIADVSRRRESLWARRSVPTGLNFEIEAQLNLLSALSPYVGNIDYPVDAANGSARYFYNNGMFPVLDAEFLYAFLCHIRPKRVVEVGSGYSSLVMADVNCREMGENMSITCIEPYPRDFLRAGTRGISRLLEQRVESVGMGSFNELVAGDVLFIDSSHVIKTGNDVNFLYLEVLPALNPGVYVHIHDIFLPDEYPEPWVVDEGRAWNEQYFLHAFLLFNNAFRVIWSAHHMHTRFPEAVAKVFPRAPVLGGGGSFWIQRT